MKESLCWTCKNSCSGCPWSRYFEPVDGWDATPTKVHDFNSFLVHNCPLYENNGFIELRVKDLCKMINISQRTFFRLNLLQLKSKFRKIGYKLYYDYDDYELKNTRYYLKRVNL